MSSCLDGIGWLAATRFLTDASMAEDVMGEGKQPCFHLLSDEMRDMGGLHLKGAVVGPEVDRVGNASTASLVDHLCRLGTRDVELQIGIFLPVSEEGGELEEITVVGVAQRRQGLGARVSVQATVESFASFDEVLPALEAVGIRLLSKNNQVSKQANVNGPNVRHLGGNEQLAEEAALPFQQCICEPTRTPPRRGQNY